ncbi:hypothetical protein Tco_0932258 [Tanacetum coccineum]
MKMERLLEPTSNKLMVGDLCDSLRIKLVTTGKKRWCNSIRIKLVPEHVEFDESNAYVLERFYTFAGNHVKEILLKLNLPDHKSILTDSKVTPTKHGRMTKPYSSPRFIANCFNAGYLKMEVKLKNFKKDATLKLFKSTNQERYEHVGPEVTRSHGGKIYKMAKRDYAWLMISRCSRSHSRQAKEQAQDLKSMITTSNHKIND